jgi:1-acyl-sn-glycerol-3-phosphate acyltransferase
MIEKIRGLFTLVQFTITVSFVIIGMYLFYSKNRAIRKTWAKMQLFLMGIKVVEHGKIDNSADMLMMNHQSIMDIVLFEAIGERNIAWVAKKEIADIPWFGRILDAPKMIIVERESKKSLIKLLKDTKDRLNDGRQISIFPEGTRSDGTKVRKFKAGAKVIAEKFALNVQPIIIIGSHDVFKSKELKQKSGQVDIIYLPVIEAKKGTDWYEELEKNMRETFEKYLKERSE